MKQELIKRLEIRKKALMNEIDLGYKLHSGHHLRDIITILAYLKNESNAKRLIDNLNLYEPMKDA